MHTSTNIELTHGRRRVYVIMTRNDDGEANLTIYVHEARGPTILYLKILNGIYILLGWGVRIYILRLRFDVVEKNDSDETLLANSHGALNDTVVMMGWGILHTIAVGIEFWVS